MKKVAFGIKELNNQCKWPCSRISVSEPRLAGAISDPAKDPSCMPHTRDVTVDGRENRDRRDEVNQNRDPERLILTATINSIGG
ncbi:hypothetical protein AVEN_90551-1 [Araneus ventricosus]|uniref:Uncharacterized protein n=1 Tax=Araneus ventricosus TaxID=182803 RepID=A0A4Y2U5W7_ARAVE|nr:hypothetical protein AVEN_90551-1 [Araneus ventricosus]